MITKEAIEAACEAFSKAYAVYPDGCGKTQITDWFELEAEDAVNFGVLKSPQWSSHSDIRSDEYCDYVAAVIKEPMLEALTAAFAAMPAEREIDEGRFEEWTLYDFAGQCRMQARENLDPEYSQFMAALAARLSALEAMPGPAVKDVGQEVKQNYNCPCIHPSQCDNSCLTPAPDLASENERLRKFKIGETVKKRSGSWWEGRVVGFYSTEQTTDGVCVQLDKPLGPVQIYPSAALERT